MSNVSLCTTKNLTLLYDKITSAGVRVVVGIPRSMSLTEFPLALFSKDLTATNHATSTARFPIPGTR